MQKHAVVVVSALMVALTPLTAKAASADWMEGMWTGQGSQSDGSSWSMKLTVYGSGGPQMFKIDYPSLGCGGSWTLISAQSSGVGGTAQLTESITYGRGKCVDGGTITVGSLRTYGNHVQTMAFHWTGRQPSGQIDYAGGTLTRVGVAPMGPPGPNNGGLQGPNGGRFVPQPQPLPH